MVVAVATTSSAQTTREVTVAWDSTGPVFLAVEIERNGVLYTCSPIVTISPGVYGCRIALPTGAGQYRARLLGSTAGQFGEWSSLTTLSVPAGVPPGAFTIRQVLPGLVSTLPIPADRLAVANWRVAGLLDGGIPTRPTCATVPPSSGDNRPALQAAIDACPAGQAVQLEAGVYPHTSYLLITRGITVRGRGRGRTVLVKTDGATAGVLTSADENANIYGGPHRFPHWQTPGRALTADAVQGQRSVTVADASDLVPGQHVEVGEDAFFTGAWRALPPVTGAPNLWEQWAGDRITWPRFRRVDGTSAVRPGDYYGPGPVAPREGSLTWHCRGDGYCLNEIKEIASVAGGVVTFTTPLTTTYRRSHVAQLAVSDSPFVAGIGIEAMTIRRGARGAISLANVSRSWVRDVEITEWTGTGIDVLQSRQVEVRGVDIHDAAWPYPGGGGYALGLKNGTTEALVWQSRLTRANKALVVNAAGAGSVLAYNRIDDTYIGNLDGWQEVGLNASHFGGSHHVLLEGNIAPNLDSDDTHGTSWAVTAYRNTLTGRRSGFTDTHNVRAVGAMAGTRDLTLWGNVLGEAGLTGWTVADGPVFSPTSRAIFRIGYAPGEWGQAADPVTVSTLVELGNYDHVTRGARTPWTGAWPVSLFLDALPAGTTLADPRTGAPGVLPAHGDPIVPNPTASVIDNFNRADGAIGADWTVLAGGINTSSNTAVPTTGADAATYDLATYGPNFEVGFTIASKPADGAGALAVGTLRDGTFNGYGATFVPLGGGFDTLRLERYDAGAPTTLDTTTTIEVSAGDALAYQQEGDTHRLYLRQSGVWSLILSATDGTYDGASDNRALISLSATNGAIDDVFAGNLAAGGNAAYYYQQMQAAFAAAK